MKSKKNRSNSQPEPESADEIPTLTEVITPGSAPPPEAILSALQSELTARTLKLAEELLHNAAREMEAVLLERVRDQLKSQLPELIDETLRAPFKKTLK